MRKIFLCLLIFSVLPLIAQETLTEPQPIIFLGILHKTYPLALKCPSEYCLEDGYLYQSTNYAIGNVNFYYEFKRDISSLAGKIVVARGRMLRGLNKILTKLGKAPEDYGKEQSMMQIRSDWVREETGFQIGHSTLEKLSQVSYFHAMDIEEYKGFSIKKADKKNIEASFTNTFDSPLVFTFAGHYESTMGKPQPRYESKEITLLPGKSITEKFPLGLGKGRKSYRLVSINVSASSKKIVIDISSSIYSALEEETTD